MNKSPIILAALILGAFAVAGTGLVALTHHHTADQIKANERASLLRKLHAIVPAQTVDNDMVTDLIEVSNPELLGANVTRVYRGRKQGQPVATVLTPVVPDGYSGPIKLLVAVRRDGTLGGVRVVFHKETPGLGDKIEAERSEWIYSFNDRSLQNPQLKDWKVKRDGGVFDQFTGATITPRAIVKAVKNTLLYVRQQQEALYRPAPAQPKDKS